MAKLLTLEDLQKNFEDARDKLSRDRQAILAGAPLPASFNHNEYGFSYLRAERAGMGAITERLKDVAWLPMQLDPNSEIILENRNAMKKWIASPLHGQPTGENFGNDFIHVLTRTAMIDGWDSANFRETALRIANLFHDLSCLIGLIYYGVWMSENNIDGLPVSDPQDLERTAQEISMLTRSPEVAQLLKKRKHIAKKTPKELDKRVTKGPPALHVIKNAGWDPPPLLN